MEPIKLTDGELNLYRELKKVADEANTAAKLYEVKHFLFWNTIKKKYDLKGAFFFNEEMLSIIEERRRS